MDELRAHIVAEARAFIGTPHIHQLREKGVGVDCAGLLTSVSKALGLSAFDVTDYERLPDGKEMVALCDREMTRITTATMQPGDAVVMRFDQFPQHIAILADYKYGGLSIVHANSAIGKVVEHRLDERWRSRIVAAYRLPKVPA